MRKLPLAACCLNVSEGCNLALLSDIAAAAVKNQLNFENGNEQQIEDKLNAFKCKTTVISVYADSYFKRGNITIAGFVPYLAKSIYEASIKVFENISPTSINFVGHPRLGAVDLIPIHPLTPAVSLKTCGDVARDVGSKLMFYKKDLQVHYYGAAANDNRSLVDLRKELKWFSQTGSSNIIHEQSVIGATPYMSVLNVMLSTDNLAIGKQIAREVRERSNHGLKGIQAMAFRKSENTVEIACNIETNDLQTKMPIFPTTFEMLEERIHELAGLNNIQVLGQSLRGFHPYEAYDITAQALREGNIYSWRERSQKMM